MYFTLEDYKKIETWLKENAIKDSDFVEATSVNPKQDILTVVIGGINYKVNVEKFLDSGISGSAISKLALTDKLVIEDITLSQDDDALLIAAEVKDKHGNELDDVNSAAKGWTVKAMDPEASEPTVRAKYGLYDYNGNLTGNTIKVYKDSAITNVYLGTTKDTCDPTTGNVTKYEIKDNNEALCIVYHLEDGTYSMANVPLGAFVHEAEFDKYKGLGVTSAGKVYVKLADDRESIRYMHFDDDGNISVSGIEDRILEDLGTKSESTAGDGTMWGEYKKEEGTPDSVDDESRWDAFKKAEAIREETSDSAHTVFSDNWDETEEDPAAWEDPVAVEAAYAYNWKAETGTADDGTTQGNMKDLYNKVITLEDSLFPLEASLTLSKSVLEYTGSAVSFVASWSVKRFNESVTPSTLTIKTDNVDMGAAVSGGGTVTGTVTTTGTHSVVLSATYNRLSVTKTSTLEVVKPMYFGFAKGDTIPTPSTLVKQSIKASPAGTYTLANSTDGDYLWLCIGDNKSINAMKNTSGFSIPYSLITTTGGYKYYRTDNGIEVGNMTFVIS